MAEEHESRAGAFSGIVAGIMVIALTAMAFVALGPERDEPMRYASIELPDPPPAVVPPRSN